MIEFFKDFYQTLFRFVRFPCATGVFTIGAPASDAPLLVTCNFDYTVRHLKRYLRERGINCYLLVVNTNGTNVWCAAAEGIFTTEKVLAALKLNHVHELVNHRVLILPQLAAVGVKRRQLESHGWQGIFGPVYFHYLDTFLRNNCRADRSMKLIEYGYWERFKMGASHGMFCTLVCAVPIWAVARSWWVGIALVWYFALSMQLLEHFVPVKRLVYKGLILALPVLALLAIRMELDVTLIRAAIMTLALGAFIGFDSQGHSHFAQSQHSGRIILVLLAVIALIYGGTFL